MDKKELDKNYEKYPLKIRLKELDDKIKVRSILTPDQFIKIEQNRQEVIHKYKNHK